MLTTRDQTGPPLVDVGDRLLLLLVFAGVVRGVVGVPVAGASGMLQAR